MIMKSNPAITQSSVRSEMKEDLAGKVRYIYWLEMLEAYFHKCVGKKEMEEMTRKVEINPGCLQIKWNNKANEMMEQSRKDSLGEASSYIQKPG